MRKLYDFSDSTKNPYVNRSKKQINKTDTNMGSTTLLPINLNNDFQTCVDFLCDAFVCSYGNADEFEKMGGAGVYRA